MRFGVRRGLAAALAWGCLTLAAHAQYPMGYGGYGWGGFSPAAGYGMEAAGLGNMAAGAGAYNVQTAQARSINANTAMQVNEYRYESLMQYDAKLYAQQQKEIGDYKEASRRTEDRLRNNPTEKDIENGDALNIAVTELSDPRYASMVGQAASRIKLSGKLIQNIPFKSAAGAISFSLDKLTDADPPPAMQGPEFKPDIAAYRSVCDELNQEVAKTGDVKQSTVKKFRDVIQAAADKLKKMDTIDQNQKNQIEMHLKTMLGLSYMFGGPSLDIYLAEAGNMKEVGLDRLLAFMTSFNVRFGPTSNPSQVQTYRTIYPMLIQVRDQLFGEGTGTLPSNAPPPRENDTRAQNFYAGMHIDALHPDKDRTPTPPAPPAPGGR